MKKFKKPSRFDYNVAVLGAGAAGLVSAYIAATVKAKVALIEKDKMGGDCLNTGCVPSKALIRSAKIANYMKRGAEFGFEPHEPEIRFDQVMDRVQQAIRTIEPHDSVERYSQLGVDCLSGSGQLITPWEIDVDGRTISAKNIILATGARPNVPRIPGLEKIDFLTSDSLWAIRELPKRLLVLGGGPIGCEMAQAFSRLGSEVTLVEKGQSVLGQEDDDVSHFVAQELMREGIDLRVQHRAVEFTCEGEQKYMLAEFDEEKVKIGFDQVFIALGRAARTEGFGLEKLGIELSDDGTIQSDPFLRTSQPNVYVCGDAAGPYQFTHVAAHQAWYASVNALFGPLKKFKVDYRVIPCATFTDPEVARVGLNEKEAIQKGIPFEVTSYGIDDLDRAIVDREAHGFIKVLTPPNKDKILGVSFVGHHAGDLISEFVLAMKHGIGLNQLLGTIHIYPTFAESNKYLAGQWKKKHVPKRALGVLERFHRWRRG